MRAPHLLVLSVVTPIVLAAAAPSAIELWTRKAGNHSTGAKMAREAVVPVDVSEGRQVTAELVDPHAGSTRVYRGVSLAPLLFSEQARGDLALLHFKNGMVIPLPLDSATLERIGPFLALAVKDGKGVFSSSFEPVAREKGLNFDPRPLAFSGNKVVVKDAAHPWSPTGSAFSPWRYADSLVGIEVVRSLAFRAQLVPEGVETPLQATVATGAEVFLSRCIYCHGARNIGGRYGWDFLTSVALHTVKDPAALHLQVTTKHLLGADIGLAMPTQKDFTLDDARALWLWSEAASKKPFLPGYQPKKR